MLGKGRTNVRPFFWLGLNDEAPFDSGGAVY